MVCGILLFNHKKQHLHYHNPYGYQTWQGGDLPGGARPTHKVT